MAQTGRWMRNLAAMVSIGLLLFGCNPNKRVPAEITMRPCPAFSADSAYSYVEQQLAFGPRVPETPAHRACGNYIAAKLDSLGMIVTQQIDSVHGYNSTLYPMRNIIGSINKDNPKRVLLCAHWDTRFIADQDPHNPNQPILGANDNASGVAVLLEIARNLVAQSPQIGVDLVFFDVEDQGRPASETSDDPMDHGYCLGSNYWTKHLDGYKADYGILLDMVGAKDAVFTLEGESYKHAQHVMERVWDTGNQLGYAKQFKYNRTWAILDDHTSINYFTEIPCIDIIQYEAETSSHFGSYWHTHSDNLEVIDRKTLQAVGQTVLQVVYNETAE